MAFLLLLFQVRVFTKWMINCFHNLGGPPKWCSRNLGAILGQLGQCKGLRTWRTSQYQGLPGSPPGSLFSWISQEDWASGPIMMFLFLCYNRGDLFLFTIKIIKLLKRQSWGLASIFSSAEPHTLASSDIVWASGRTFWQVENIPCSAFLTGNCVKCHQHFCLLNLDANFNGWLFRIFHQDNQLVSS